MLFRMWAIVLTAESVAAFVHYNFGVLPTLTNDSLEMMAGTLAWAVAVLMWREAKRR